MDTQTLLENFDTVANTPAGLERLRNLILELAVSGRLTEQQPEDGGVREQLAFIAGLVQPSKLVDPIANGRIPWKIPTSWRWVRFKEIVDFSPGKTPSTKDSSYWEGPELGELWAAIGDMPDSGTLFTTSRAISQKAVAEVMKKPPAPVGALLMSFKLTIGKVCRVGRPTYFNEAIIEIDTPREVTKEFLFRTLPLLALGGSSKAAIKGNTLNKGSITNIPIPFPPLGEQERIVAKVDELMQLCDEVEARQQQCQRTSKRFRGSSFASLISNRTNDEFRAAWSRVHANWRTLTGTPEGVAELRGAIREVALQGRLVPQRTSDGASQQLLTTLKERNPSKQKPITTPFRDAGLHQIPSSWQWAQLGDLLDGIQAGKSPTAQKRPKTASEWGVLKVSACSWGKFLAAENKALLPDTEPNEAFEVQQGDFLISRANTQQLVARSVIVDETPRRLLISDKTLRLSVSPNCDARYLNLANLGPAARAHYERNASGTSDSMRNVSQPVIRAAPIPLPPPGEQVRIVEAADSLLQLCDDLEASLNSQIEASIALAERLTAVS